MSHAFPLFEAGLDDARLRVRAEAERLERMSEDPSVGTTAIIDGEQAVEINDHIYLSGQECPVL